MRQTRRVGSGFRQEILFGQRIKQESWCCKFTTWGSSHDTIVYLVGGDWLPSILNFPINIGNVIIPIDELHHFSEGWPNHQADMDS